MLTGDLNMIDVEWVVQYRIDDPIKFLYEMREPTRTLRDISESVMRRIVGNMLGSEVLTVGRVEIQQKAREEIQQIAGRLQRGHPDQHRRNAGRGAAAGGAAGVQRGQRGPAGARAHDQRGAEAGQPGNPERRGCCAAHRCRGRGLRHRRVNRAYGESVRFSAVLAEYRQAPEVTSLEAVPGNAQRSAAQHRPGAGRPGGPDEPAAAAGRQPGPPAQHPHTGGEQ